jgi:glycosyl transferase family 87
MMEKPTNESGAGIQHNPFRLALHPKFAFLAAIAIGAALRFYCVVFTNGTGDMDDWEDHAQQVHDRGLIGYYHANSFANHPPFISEVGCLILQTSALIHVPFRILFRALFALLDAGNACLLFALLPSNRSRFFATACYWLSPVAIIISSFHGNTDTAVAFFLLFSVWLATKMRTAASGVAFGAGLWIKLPGILALPALMAFFRRWPQRGIFLLAAAITASITYIPALVEDYKIVWTNVFGYRGLILQTTSGLPLWGPSVLLFSTFAPPEVWPDKYLRPTLFILERTWYIGIAAMFALMWLRRKRHSPEQICATIGMAYFILLGFSDYWAFQYFAWALPFWFFLGRWFSIPAVILTSVYLYSLHWLFCGNPWLLGRWNFSAHSTLPFLILSVRNLAVAFFLISACVFLIDAVRCRSTSVASLN